MIEGCSEPVNFKELFKEIAGEEYPQKRIYKGKMIFLIDKFPVKNQENLIFSIESVNSPYPQGFYINIENGYLKVNNESMEYKKEANVLFWEDSTVLDVRNIKIQVFTKRNYICIGNIWEETIYEEPATRVHEDLRMESYTRKYPEGKKITCYTGAGRCAVIDHTCANAMYSEDIPYGKRYFCNDGDDDDDFDDIIFTVQRQTGLP